MPKPNKSNDGGHLLAGDFLDLKDGKENFAFIRDMIRSLVDKQSPAVQAAVLFIFMFLFVYLVVFTVQASMVVTAKVQVELTRNEIEQKRRRGIHVEDISYKPPELGYHIAYNGHSYALNSDGETRIDLSIPMYTWVIARRQLSVLVKTPDLAEYPRPMAMEGLTLASIRFTAESQLGPKMGSVNVPWGEGGLHSLAGSFSYVVSAEARVARPTDRRLYLQSITAASTVATANVSATLVTKRAKYSLQSLSSDVKPGHNVTVLVKGGASIVQDYNLFFALDSRSASSGGQISLEEQAFLGNGYSEMFPLPTELKVGSPITIKGASGGIIVLQMAYPIDVILFERRDTSDMTDALIPRLTDVGYVPRVNKYAVSSKGRYNVVYSGADVPSFALRRVLDVMSEVGITIRYIQPKIRLSNGLQNQIQVGSNPKVACLPVIDLKGLTHSMDDFDARIADLPQPGTCVGG